MQINPAIPKTPNVLLFPLCDARGWVTSVLCNQPSAVKHMGYRPDALFFAWLTDLPARVRPADAARSLLTVAGLDNQPPPKDSISGETVHSRLHLMLAELASARP